jgi:ankyrin repeat protein
VVDLLLTRGADLDAGDNRGRTPLMIAAALGDAATAALLLQRGADRTRRDNDGKTALDLAANDEVRAKLSTR